MDAGEGNCGEGQVWCSCGLTLTERERKLPRLALGQSFLARPVGAGAMCSLHSNAAERNNDVLGGEGGGGTLVVGVLDWRSPVRDLPFAAVGMYQSSATSPARTYLELSA